MVHAKHGLGVVKGWVTGGRLEVLFDDRQRYSYRLSALARKVS